MLHLTCSWEPRPFGPQLESVSAFSRAIHKKGVGRREGGREYLQEDTTLAGGMDLAYRAEDHVPIRAAEVCGCAQAGDGVGVGGVEHDVGCVGGGDFGC